MSNADEIAVLERAHRLFGGTVAVPGGVAPAEQAQQAVRDPHAVQGPGFDRYRSQAIAGRQELVATAGSDGRLSSIMAGAAAEHEQAKQATRVILDAARADSAPAADTPMGQRELMLRRAARLRAQHRVVSSARARALRRLALLRALRYRGIDPQRLAALQLPGAPNPRAATAVRYALSKLGCPYVWGATGPNQFDCSGLVQQAWRSAGVPLSRTTYDMIHQGVAVPRAAIAPGDLVFPHTGHVQMYVGNGQVVEAPYSGANVRIAQLGTAVAIRRPLV
ncbi:MAG: C40 family peptidase [Mycolicibacterium sp.]|uniref:C40 family peptidase n=1 Tax=Mycolicibacterium sp. TaxID=2320850 RepID=UPI003D13B8E2